MIEFASASVFVAIREAINNAVPTASVFSVFVIKLILSSPFRFYYLPFHIYVEIFGSGFLVTILPMEVYVASPT